MAEEIKQGEEAQDALEVSDDALDAVAGGIIKTHSRERRPSTSIPAPQPTPPKVLKL